MMDESDKLFELGFVEQVALRSAPLPFAPLRSAPLRSAPLRSAPLRSPPLRSAPLPSPPSQTCTCTQRTHPRTRLRLIATSLLL